MFWSQLLKILIILFNLQSLPLLRIDFTGPSSSIPWRETFFFVAFNLLLAARTINSSCPLVFFNSIVKSPITSAANNDIYYFNIKKREYSNILPKYQSILFTPEWIYLQKFPLNCPLPLTNSCPTLPINW